MSTRPNSTILLREIERWKLEAKNEDNARYFLPFEELEAITDREAIYVIGRKGCGKTAIAEHIRSTVSSKIFSRSLSFKNFPFNDLYDRTDGRFTPKSQYITLWKYIIYSAVCQQMATNEAIAPEATLPLRAHFTMDFDKALARSLTEITQRSVGITILKAGVTGGYTKTFIENDTPWVNRVDGLEDLIGEYIDDSTYYILFDELDEDYKEILDVNRKSQYFDLLAGLFKAAHEVHYRFKGIADIRPIIFLRDDIFDIIEDVDKNKWEDLSVNLNWTVNKLEGLTAFRISRALDADGQILGFSEALREVFASDTIRHGVRTRNRRHIFKHILDRTLIRPRDVISYMREAAKIARLQGKNMITPSLMRDADREYSKRMRKEFVDEVHSVIPNIHGIFNMLSNIRKQSLTVIEFKRAYEKLAITSEGMLPFEYAARLLFYFSIIGNQPAQKNITIFKYREPFAEMNFTENIIIHRGMLKSLQIN
ncbi:hypothetical protein [Sphingobium sp.]|uniref:P-loop ATPase, Sll1717 family n=1 Tax=Sphingobium sp. TaxID=1912891 RepID=UPI00260F6214|nr:hypothetical protein [Sphingobium sp.]